MVLSLDSGRLHKNRNVVVLGAYVVNFLWRHGDYGRPGPVTVGPLALSAAALILLAVSGVLGGRLAYRYGVRVAAESIQAEGFHP